VLTLDIGGPAFLAQSGGIAVPANPSTTLVSRMTEAMESMLTDRNRWSEAGRRRAEDSLAWERIVDVYDGIYQRVLDGT
jgi:glycosyltransferase involved in cell wall biosynthesis